MDEFTIQFFKEDDHGCRMKSACPDPKPCDQSCDTLQVPLAMAYVPYQCWGATYDAETALVRGTVFPILDLPFCGKGSAK